MTRVSAVEKNAVIAERFPLLAEVMTYIAHPQIRNRGTFGGAIAHADPAAQLPALSLLMNAGLKIQNTGGERLVAAEDFFLGPFMTVIEPEELLSEVVLRPLPALTGSSYKQVSRQRGGYAQVAVAAAVTLNPDGSCRQVRLVLISVGDTPILSKEASRILVGQKPGQDAFQAVAEAVVKTEIDPGSDVHATADYRRHLTRVLVDRALTEAFERAAVEGV
jgi:CO/xanthine dehydrogenase FAD-binding subunit